MKAIVDKDLCIGCGLCPEICSEVFEMDDDGKAIASDMEIPDELQDDAQDAASQCPVDAIAVE
ncbi:MAG: ferredoxin [Eubacteriales bacterium]